jgi:hypothetical protein
MEKKDTHSFAAIDSIERLSKGQNTWQLLSVRLPTPIYDMGTHSMPNEIILFGGFRDGSLSQMALYRPDQGTDGEFSRLDSTLEKADFFSVNGVHVRSNETQVVFAGH